MCACVWSPIQVRTCRFLEPCSAFLWRRQTTLLHLTLLFTVPPFDDLKIKHLLKRRVTEEDRKGKETRICTRSRHGQELERVENSRRRVGEAERVGKEIGWSESRETTGPKGKRLRKTRQPLSPLSTDNGPFLGRCAYAGADHKRA